MDLSATTRSNRTMADLPQEASRLAVNIAQCECVCLLRQSVCLLTNAGQRAGIQPFLYEAGSQ